MILSPAGPGDAPALAALHALAFDAPWSAAQIAGLLETAGTFALAAGGDGMILARRMFEEAEILTLAVAPAARRRGLGRTLVEAAAGLSARQGAQVMFLEVGEDNPGAMALYRACGFVDSGRRRGYYQRGDRRVDALVMRRDLNSGRP